MNKVELDALYKGLGERKASNSIQEYLNIRYS